MLDLAITRVPAAMLGGGGGAALPPLNNAGRSIIGSAYRSALGSLGFF